jgi:hypothetical protein
MGKAKQNHAGFDARNNCLEDLKVEHVVEKMKIHGELMTRKRYDNHSTEFGLWLREQEELKSSLGFVATNLDFIWSNYKTNK